MPIFELFGTRFEAACAPHGAAVFQEDEIAPTDQAPIAVKFIYDYDFRSPPPRVEELQAFSEGSRRHWVWEADDGHHFRIADALEALVNRSLSELTIRLAPGETLERGLLFLSGAFVTFLLILRGQWPLHASAVRYKERTIAFVSPSGGGKTTWAAGLCTWGAELIADDVLVTVPSEAGLQGFLGLPLLRLRTADLIPEGAPALRAPDGRYLWRPPQGPTRSTIDAVVLPARGATPEPSLRRLPPHEAVYGLAACPRIPGWRSRTMLERQFRTVAGVARLAPVVRVSVPREWSTRRFRDELPALIESLF